MKRDSRGFLENIFTCFVQLGEPGTNRHKTATKTGISGSESTQQCLAPSLFQGDSGFDVLRVYGMFWCMLVTFSAVVKEKTHGGICCL